MRTLDFTPDTAEIFELIHTSLMVTPKELTKKEFRLHQSILEKLEEISTFKDTDKDSRTLNAEGGKALLEEAEYTLVNECCNAVKYRAGISRRVNSMWNFLESIPEEKIKKVD